MAFAIVFSNVWQFPPVIISPLLIFYVVFFYVTCKMIHIKRSQWGWCRANKQLTRRFAVMSVETMALHSFHTRPELNRKNRRTKKEREKCKRPNKMISNGVGFVFDFLIVDEEGKKSQQKQLSRDNERKKERNKQKHHF